MNSLPFSTKLRAPWVAIVLGTTLSALVAGLDWWTGPEIQMGAFYVIPAIAAGWAGGRFPGLVVSLVSNALSLLVELAWGRSYHHPSTPEISGFLQLCLTAFSAAITAELRQREEKLQFEIQARKTAEHDLILANQDLERRVEERTRALEHRALDLVRSQGALQRQTLLLKSVLAGMGDGVVVTDPAGWIHLINRVAAGLLNIPNLEAVQPDWIDSPTASLPELLRSFSPFDYASVTKFEPGAGSSEVEIRRLSIPPEEPQWLSLNCRPLPEETGAPRGVIFLLSDITARKKTDALVTEVSEREQRRFGQDLHDGLGQLLVSAAFATTILHDKLSTLSLPEAADVTEIAALLNAAIAQSKNLARGLHPVELDAEGLTGALEELAEQTSRAAGISCVFNLPLRILVHDFQIASNLYRIAQESVSNALKHGEARGIRITLEEIGDRIRLTISNDGRNFSPPAHPHRGMGLHLMRYRARIIGADLKIDAAPNGGTEVTCSTPNLKQP